MNVRIKDFHVFIMYILSSIGIFIVILSNTDALWNNLILSLCWLASFTIRNLFIYKTDKYKNYAFITYLAEIFILFFADSNTAGSSVKLLLCITTADSFIALNAFYGIVCGILSFSFYIIPLIINEQNSIKNIFLIIIVQAPAFLFTGLVSYMLGRVLKSNALVEESMHAAQIREVELKAAYDELSIAYQNLEEMSAVKERNRIAREIHDTVGHTITTVIVELEAGRMLAEKDQATAFNKFSMAYKQAVRALKELRGSVRLLAEEEQKDNFEQAVGQVIRDAESHTGITVKSIINVPKDMEKNIASMVIRILKEGISNGIRHGGGTAFFFKLDLINGILCFYLSDNGRGCSNIVPGFGLNNIKESVLNTHGKAEFCSEPGEGFEIKIELPVKGED
ncbi:MAG: sensor histidine kinase [Bacillota bacterium]|nr:sensor histidine kinase [Bacillota bacterium]